MPAAAATKATGQAIANYLSALQYGGGGNVYNLAQLEQINDVVAQLTSTIGACAEVYGNLDAHVPAVFGGGTWDEQSWYILSMCSLDTPAKAAVIYDIRDALVTSLTTHTVLGGTIPGLFYAQFKRPESGRFLRIERMGKIVQAHVIELKTKVAWSVALVP